MRSRIARSAKREGERGFALLLVFLLASAIALMLYQQVPRVAFESERDKEQLLIDRGEQYKRAIQQFYVAYKRYPNNLEELEKTNDKRYLRHRYVDPYTGKDEWRLIHVNAAGQLTDSLVKKLPDPNNPNSQQTSTNGASGTNPGGVAGSNPAGSPGSSLSSLASNLTAGGGASSGFPGNGSFPANGAFPQNPAGGGVPGAPPGPNDVNAAVLRRPSDRPLAPGQFPANTNPAPVDPNNPNNGFNQPQPGQVVPGQPGFPQSTNTFNNNQPNNNPSAFNNNNFSANTALPSQDFPPISLQAMQQQQGNGAALNNSVPGQVGQNPAGNQVRLGQNGQFIPVTPNPANPNQPFTGQPGAQAFPGSQQFPGAQPFPGAQQSPGAQPFPTGTPGQFPDPNAAGAAQAGVAVGGSQGPGGSNAALGLINQILTTPRQPPAGVSTGAATNATSGGLGLAGVASTYDGPSVKVYKDRKKFKEWEFIFDLQSLMPQAPAAATGATPGNGQNPLGGPATPAGSTSAPSAGQPLGMPATPPTQGP